MLIKILEILIRALVGQINKGVAEDAQVEIRVMQKSMDAAYDVNKNKSRDELRARLSGDRLHQDRR